MKTLTDEKKRLEEDIRNHTQKVATLEAKLDNMKNDNADIKRELAEVRPLVLCHVLLHACI